MHNHSSSHSHAALPLGLASVERLPTARGHEQWDRVVVDASVRSRLQSYALFLLNGRQSMSRVAVPAHGVILLSGPPGTGKTTLARGLADWTARALVERGMAAEVVFASIDPHAVESDLLGATERAVAALFSEHLPALGAPDRAVIVLLDEAETLAMSRQQVSMQTNPVDVYRSTNSVLTGLDELGALDDRFLIIATSNDPEVLDPAFLSRVDLQETIGLPTLEAIAFILRDCFVEITGRPPADAVGLEAIARRLYDNRVDARQVRKTVIRAIVDGGFDLALAPASLTVDHVAATVERELAGATDALSAGPHGAMTGGTRRG